MKLDHLHIRNLRSCKDVSIPVSSYTCLVGANGAGKSTILTALNIFFRESQHAGSDLTSLVQEDFHQKNTDESITITLTFTDLSPAAQQDFKDYYRNDKLIVTAEARFNTETQTASVQQYGERLGMEEFASFFKSEGTGAKVAELKEIYNQLRSEVAKDLPAPGPKDAMVQALRAYEGEHPDRCKPIRSGDEFYGFSKGANRLAKYIQWVYVPAVKDASSEQMDQKNTALAKLLERTVRAKTSFTNQVNAIKAEAQTKYQAVLDENQDVLDDLSESLRTRLAGWAHPDALVRIRWWQDPQKAVNIQEPAAQIEAGEDNFQGRICRLGHGLQRCYLLALLQELAVTDDENAPTLLLGCEEPELYQHPSQARHLFDVFQQLAADSSQILVTTHSPYFVSGETFEDLRMVRKDPLTKASQADYVRFKEIADSVARATGRSPVKPSGMRAKLQQTLQADLNEMFFSRRLILVEGLEDIAYITSHLQLSGWWEPYRRLGCQMIACEGKDHIIQPLAIAKALSIPTLVVFDSDSTKYGVVDPANDPQGKRAADRAMHLRDNTAILKLCGIANPDPFPTDTLFGESVVMWNSEIGSVVRDDIGREDWKQYKAAAERELGQPGNLEKNSLQIAICLEKAWADGKRSTHLDRLCELVLRTSIPDHPTPQVVAIPPALVRGAA